MIDDPRRKGRRGGRRRGPRLVIAALIVAGVATAWLVYPRRPLATGTATPGDVPAGTVPPKTADRLSAAGLPSLPQGRLAGPREVVEEAYLFAAQHPEVLSHVPCFCGCERQGHRSNHDCFVASRAPTGEIAWTAHGLG